MRLHHGPSLLLCALITAHHCCYAPSSQVILIRLEDDASLTPERRKELLKDLQTRREEVCHYKYIAHISGS